MSTQDELRERVAALESTIDDLEAANEDLAAQLRSQQERDGGAGVSRRGALGLGALGLGGLLGRVTTTASAASGSVGTPSNPVDVYAGDIRSASVGTDELGVGDEYAVRETGTGMEVEHEPSTRTWTLGVDGVLETESVTATSIDTGNLNTNRVFDTSGRYHGELTGSNDAQVVIDAIQDRAGKEGIVIPDPGFALDWEQQVDIPHAEHGFSVETLGLPTLSIPSGFSGSSAIRKPATNGGYRGYRGYRIGGFSFEDNDHQLDWAINLSNVKESVIRPSIFRDCPAIRIHSNDGYANQNKIIGPLIKSDQGRGPGILLDSDSDTRITADQNWIYSPCFSDGGNSTETAYIDRGKHNSWIYTRVEFARICHSQEPRDADPDTGAGSSYGKNYYISSGGWDRSGDFEYTVREVGKVRGIIERVYGNLDYDKLQLSSPSTIVRHVGDPKSAGANTSSNASNLLDDLYDITPVQSFESVGIQDTSDANSAVSYTAPWFTRPRLHFDAAADETCAIDLGTGALDDAGYPKATQSFSPRGETGPSGVVARWGFYRDDSNRAELVYDPENVLGGHGTPTWYLEVENGGTVDGSIDLGTTPDSLQLLTLNHREDANGNRYWSATTDQSQDGYEHVRTSRLGGGTWRWLIRSVDGTSHGWAIDLSEGATLWRR